MKAIANMAQFAKRKGAAAASTRTPLKTKMSDECCTNLALMLDVSVNEFFDVDDLFHHNANSAGVSATKILELCSSNCSEQDILALDESVLFELIFRLLMDHAPLLSYELCANAVLQFNSNSFQTESLLVGVEERLLAYLLILVDITYEKDGAAENLAPIIFRCNENQVTPDVAQVSIRIIQQLLDDWRSIFPYAKSQYDTMLQTNIDLKAFVDGKNAPLQVTVEIPVAKQEEKDDGSSVQESRHSNEPTPFQTSQYSVMEGYLKMYLSPGSIRSNKYYCILKSYPLSDTSHKSNIACFSSLTDSLWGKVPIDLRQVYNTSTIVSVASRAEKKFEGRIFELEIADALSPGGVTVVRLEAEFSDLRLKWTTAIHAEMVACKEKKLLLSPSSGAGVNVANSVSVSNSQSLSSSQLNSSSNSKAQSTVTSPKKKPVAREEYSCNRLAFVSQRLPSSSTQQALTIQPSLSSSFQTLFHFPTPSMSPTQINSTQTDDQEEKERARMTSSVQTDFHQRQEEEEKNAKNALKIMTHVMECQTNEVLVSSCHVQTEEKVTTSTRCQTDADIKDMRDVMVQTDKCEAALEIPARNYDDDDDEFDDVMQRMNVADTNQISVSPAKQSVLQDSGKYSPVASRCLRVSWKSSYQTNSNNAAPMDDVERMKVELTELIGDIAKIKVMSKNRKRNDAFEFVLIVFVVFANKDTLDQFFQSRLVGVQRSSSSCMVGRYKLFRPPFSEA